jgi:hypothetical protein
MRGIIYGCLVFLVAQVVFMPLVGGGFFSRGDPALIIGSLLGHHLYGAVVGWSYGAEQGARATSAGRDARAVSPRST